MTEAEILSLLGQYGYFALVPVFAAIGIYAGLLAGGLIALDVLSPVLTLLIYVVSLVARDAILYRIARGGTNAAPSWLSRFSFGRRLLRQAEELVNNDASGQSFTEWFRDSSQPIVFFSRIVPVPGVSLAMLVAFMAGVMKISWRRIVLPMVFGQAILCSIVLGIGYVFTDAVTAPETPSTTFATTLAILLAVTAAFVVLWRVFYRPLKQTIRLHLSRPA